MSGLQLDHLIPSTIATNFNATAFPREKPTAWSQTWPQLLGVILVSAFALFVKGRVQQAYFTSLFFARIYDLLTSKFRATNFNAFSFTIFNLPVTAIRGNAARKSFFENKNLSNSEGYRIFGGPDAVAKLDGNHVHPDKDENITRFMLRITELVQLDRFADAIPSLFDAMTNLMTTWGDKGTIDPFQNIYDLAFQINVHMATCREFSSDISALSDFKSHFLNVETNTHPNSIVFPWFYRGVKRSKAASIKALHSKLNHLVEKRRQASVPNSDAIDLLLAQDVSTPDIVLLSLGSIFAGVSNTSKTAIWLIIYIAIHSQWKAAIRAELEPLIRQYGNAAEPLEKQLAAIPIPVWEDSMPTVDLVMRETMRLAINHTALRRNVGETFDMPGGVGKIKRGSFLAYSLADSHLDSGVYSNPLEFDPERFLPDREVDTSAFLGWGAGRHRCLAQKLARLEIKSIVALFVMSFEYDVIGADGMIADMVPSPDYNDVQLAKPKGGRYFLRYKRLPKLSCVGNN